MTCGEEIDWDFFSFFLFVALGLIVAISVFADLSSSPSTAEHLSALTESNGLSDLKSGGGGDWLGPGEATRVLSMALEVRFLQFRSILQN